jgi:hypothetical protein
LPFLLAKKEVYDWLKTGQKTIDIRRGKPQKGNTVVFQCGPRSLEFTVVKTEQGKLTDLVNADNFRLVIPSAATLADALGYLGRLFGDYNGVCVAYFLGERVR